MLEEDRVYVDAMTAASPPAQTALLLLIREVLALWPRPAPDGVLLPGYGDVICWSLN